MFSFDDWISLLSDKEVELALVLLCRNLEDTLQRLNQARYPFL